MKAEDLKTKTADELKKALLELKKEQFTFSKVVRRMGVAAKKAEEPVPK